MTARRDDIRALAARDFADHVLTTEGPGRWRCQKPGTWVMGFRVITAPGLVVVAGDIGDVIFGVSDDGEAWARRERQALFPDYACGKIIASPEGRRPRLPCDEKVAEELAALEREHDGEVWADWKAHLDGDDPTPEEFVRFVEAGGFGPDAPDIWDWSSSALWAFHALCWWARAMDRAEAARG